MNTAASRRKTAFGQLATLLGGRYSTNPSLLEQHGRDEGHLPESAPEAVVFPDSTAEVQQIAAICYAHDVPMIPYGAGTSLEGQVIPTQGGISVDLSRMDRILQTNVQDLDAHMEAGVTRRQLNDHLRDQGLFFPVDPGANATLGGMEYRRFWRGSVAPGDYPAATGSQVITTLEAINALVRRWLAGDYRADNLAFEILLGEVATGDGGALLEGLALQGAWLNAAENLLAERRNRGPLCAPGIRHEAADILPNVVQKFFVGGVQPYAAVLGRRQHQLLPPVEELETLLETVLPPAFRTWQQERNALLDQLVAAPRRQVEQLKLVLAPCGGFPVAGQVTG